MLSAPDGWLPGLWPPDVEYNAGMPENRLYFGDNLEVLRQRVPDESVDLVYLDPPFNSNRNYSVIFSKEAAASPNDNPQIEAFEDTWHWTHAAEEQYQDFVTTAPSPVAGSLEAFRKMLGENDAMAYLVNMAPRLVELHRVLKPTGSLYLHCDPTMSHYLKILLDGVFDVSNFRDEIVWLRHNARSVKQAIWPRLHDVILFYGKSRSGVFRETRIASSAKSDPHDIVTWADGKRYRTKDLTGPGTRNGETGQSWRSVNPTASGRHWRVAHSTLEQLEAADRLYWQKNGMPRERDEEPYDPAGRSTIVGDVWTDISSINSGAAERLRYPTQKPVTLLERIISASSNPGDVVLDPFCGCGTTVDAAQKLGRRWIGIDITYIALDLIIKRLTHTYGKSVVGQFEVSGIPRDLAAARAMFEKDPFEFERWAVSFVDAQPNARQVKDRGVDGVGRFVLDSKGSVGRVLVSVKGGKNLTPAIVRDLSGTVRDQEAQMGLLITLQPATKGIVEAVHAGGAYKTPWGESYPRLQHITVAELLAGQRPKLPPMKNPYVQAKERVVVAEHEQLF